MVFTPDGRRLIAVGSDSVRVWDIETQRQAYPALNVGNGKIVISLMYDMQRS